MSICRLATHTAPLHEPMLYARVKVVPRFINRSRLGVSISVSPIAPTAS